MADAKPTRSVRTNLPIGSSKRSRAAHRQCVANQWNQLSPLPGVKEIADLGGLTIAYKAFEKWQPQNPRRVIDGFTPEQRFFLGWAQV